MSRNRAQRSPNGKDVRAAIWNNQETRTRAEYGEYIIASSGIQEPQVAREIADEVNTILEKLNGHGGRFDDSRKFEYLRIKDGATFFVARGYKNKIRRALDGVFNKKSLDYCLKEYPDRVRE